MFKHIMLFVRFLFPILRTTVVQVAADVLTRAAYPDSRPQRARHTQYDSNPPFKYDAAGFHDVLLVAFDLSGPNANLVHEWLHNQMPTPGESLARGENDETVTVNLDSWWVANDERFHVSDCDSAVFVKKGWQKPARELLIENNLAN